MKKEIEHFISLVIPESVLGDNNLTFLERLILIEIMSLCKKYGYCWASNCHFMNIFGSTKPTISKSISSLSRNGYINIEFDNSQKNNSKRIIKLSGVLKENITRIKENANTSVQNNYNHNNKYNENRKDIFNKKFYIDEYGNEYWNGKKCESDPATDEQIQELEELLKDFKDKED